MSNQPQAEIDGAATFTTVGPPPVPPNSFPGRVSSSPPPLPQLCRIPAHARLCRDPAHSSKALLCRRVHVPRKGYIFFDDDDQLPGFRGQPLSAMELDRDGDLAVRVSAQHFNRLRDVILARYAVDYVNSLIPPQETPAVPPKDMPPASQQQNPDVTYAQGDESDDVDTSSLYQQ